MQAQLRTECQWAWKIDPLWALKNYPPPYGRLELEIRVKMTGHVGEHVSRLPGKVLSVVLSLVPDDRRPRNTSIAFAGELNPVPAKYFYLSQAPRPSPSSTLGLA
jgi:hypothetical protein